MNTIRNVRKLFKGAALKRGAAMGPPTIVMFGDSHTHAVQRAIGRRQAKGRNIPLTAHRLLKTKNGNQLGDKSFEDFLEIAENLLPSDVVISTIGGNQHAILTTIQHPVPFDFLMPDSPSRDERELDRQIIPYRALVASIRSEIASRDGQTLKALRQATKAHVVHVIPPPPKRDNDHITRYHETRFIAEISAGLGVSPPELRLKAWKVQTSILIELCDQLGITVMMPPQSACDSDGYLRPDYYANDATHANTDYGELLLQEIETGIMSRHIQ